MSLKVLKHTFAFRLMSMVQEQEAVVRAWTERFRKETHLHVFEYAQGAIEAAARIKTLEYLHNIVEVDMVPSYSVLIEHINQEVVTRLSGPDMTMTTSPIKNEVNRLSMQAWSKLLYDCASPMGKFSAKLRELYPETA